MSSTRLVYDSERGRLDQCPRCGKRYDRCTCGQPRRAPAPAGAGAQLPRDGVVRILRDRKGRGGKVVTVVAGVPGGAETLEQLAKDLKRQCGTGGTVKEGTIEIQGDHRERVAAALNERGYTVKLAGG